MTCSSSSTAATPSRSSNHDGHYVIVIDVDIDIKTDRRQAHGDVVAELPHHRHRHREARPRSGGGRAGLRARVHARDGRAACDDRRSNSTAATPRCVRTRPSIGDLFADAMRAEVKAEVAITNGGGIRAGKIYPPGSAITQRDILAELPFGNKLLRLTVTGAELRAALENGFSALPQTGGTISANFGNDRRDRPVASAPAAASSRSRWAACRWIRRRNTPSRPTTSWRAAATVTCKFRSAARLVPDDDAPLLANAVMAYLRGAGHSAFACGAEGLW